MISDIYIYTALQVSPAHCSGKESIHLKDKDTIIPSDIIGGPSNCISSNQPFSISAQPGQTLNVSLFDFNHDQTQMSYGKLKDIGDGKEVTLQGGNRRQHVMDTSGHQIDITIYTSSKLFAIDVAGTIYTVLAFTFFYPSCHTFKRIFSIVHICMSTYRIRLNKMFVLL